MLQPVHPRGIGTAFEHRRPPHAGREVVQHDQATRPQPVLWVQRRLVLLALSAAVEHQQVEGRLAAKLAPVCVQHVYCRDTGEDQSGRVDQLVVPFNAHKANALSCTTGEPRQPDAASRPGFPDDTATDTAGEDLKQPAVRREAGQRKPALESSPSRGVDQRWQVSEVAVRLGPSRRHGRQCVGPFIRAVRQTRGQHIHRRTPTDSMLSG